MEKLKPYLLQLRKHHFWVLTGIALITALVGWSMAAGALSKAYAAGKSKIEGNFSKMSAINNTPNHPNETFKTGVDAKTADLKKDVLGAWKLVYGEQNRIASALVKIGNILSDHNTVRVVPRTLAYPVARVRRLIFVFRIALGA